MVGSIRRWQQRHWRGRSKAERVELHTVVTWYCTPWVFLLTWLLIPLLGGLDRRPVPLVLGGLLLLVGTLQCATANRLTRPVLDHYLGRAKLPAGAQYTSAVLLGLALALVLALTALHAADPVTTRLAIGAGLLPFGLLHGLIVPVRVFLRRSAVLALLLMAVSEVARPDGLGLLMTGAVTAFGALLSLLACRCGAWTLAVLWEAERGREVEARLAVAEERLRFGRDLHDVLGRNLSVISLKSELAVQLARRGRPEAVEQMIEVQRIAQDSQREVRAVVRGYREADLDIELAGARGVLAAAGINCEIHAETVELPAEVQSALGWVVREAATNVLRHGDAGHCTVELRIQEGNVVLTVENDGADHPSPTGNTGHMRSEDHAGGGADRIPGSHGSGGSGLAGLRERLAAVDGSLEATAVGQDRFRLMAEVPLVNDEASRHNDEASRHKDRDTEASGAR
ncbi:sensor histidine kinase [Streptomyces sp. MUSC 125]|uniref:sensor histidine kinase n=1 Tax=Streptomyces sp. MUSC 125 TaxID=1428624 RepID=UPI00099CB026|nr:histidine kinase [Streptomyces sp. MUSC 125]